MVERNCCFLFSLYSDFALKQFIVKGIEPSSTAMYNILQPHSTVHRTYFPIPIQHLNYFFS